MLPLQLRPFQFVRFYKLVYALNNDFHENLLPVHLHTNILFVCMLLYHIKRKRTQYVVLFAYKLNWNVIE